MKQLTQLLDQSEEVQDRVKIGHNCSDIKGMKETEASIQRQHVMMTYYSKSLLNHLHGDVQGPLLLSSLQKTNFMVCLTSLVGIHSNKKVRSNFKPMFSRPRKVGHYHYLFQAFSIQEIFSIVTLSQDVHKNEKTCFSITSLDLLDREN